MCIRDRCKEKNTPEAHMIEKGLKRLGQPASEVLPAIENVGSYEVGRLERGLPLLATIAAGAPMIGFLGTVTGMVQAFFDLANAPGGIDVSLLSSGIYQDVYKRQATASRLLGGKMNYR